MTPIVPGSRRSAGDLWAITSFFNPIGYRRRYANYRRFRERLDVPLLAVEFGYREQFELADDDAEIVVRLRGRDVLWQKERLLNLAVDALPASCRKIVCVDCDILFDDPDWAGKTSAALDRFALVQPFSTVDRTPPGWTPGTAGPPTDALRSAPSLIAGGMPVAVCMGSRASEVGCAHGYAWAANRDLLQRRPIYDACIVGGGDTALLRAAYGRPEDTVRFLHMKEARAAHYRDWARPFHDEVRGSVGYVAGTIFHLWHGGTANRRYAERQQALGAFDFDPAADIAVDRSGAWRWSSDKPDMHASVRDYFAARCEDEALSPAGALADGR